jgi:4-hydroxybenzoate polyprenyltransferase/phosphoserine phosphatase
VDLDGTLVKTDLLLETVLLLLKRNLLYLFVLPFWLLRGKAFLKQEVSRRVNLDVAVLPYNQEVLALLHNASRAGRTLVLATAADRKVAQQVADHLGLFSAVFASDGRVNLGGRNKREVLEQHFGDGGFDYMGDSAADLAVWQTANKGIVVNGSPRLIRRARAHCPVEVVREARPSLLKVWVRALRVHQWVKNGLLFVPLVASHQLTNVGLFGAVLVGLVAFCLCASSVYVLNDLLDLEADRHHPKKKRRPFASGALPLTTGAALTAACLTGAVLVSLLLPPLFRVILGAYYALTLGYSLYFKRKLLVDVHFLGGLYTIRVLAGGAAAGIICSPWLLGFSMFLFLSLALVKRFAELRNLEQQQIEVAKGRGYQASDLQVVCNLGTASGFCCVLVLALYISSPQIEPLYKTPAALWMLCPLVMYWISRVWVVAHRGKMDVDPVVFALKDKVSYLVGACAALVISAARIPW